MTQSIFRVILLSVLLMLGCSACQGSDAALETMTLTASLNDDQSPGTSQTIFGPEEPIFLALQLTSAYEGLEIKVSINQNGKNLSEQTLSVPRSVDSLDPLWLSTPLSVDEPGLYECTVFIPDLGSQILSFEIQTTEEP